MWTALLAALIASYGLDPKASNEQGVAHLKTMTDEQRKTLAEALGGDSGEKIASLMKPADPAVAQLRTQIITDDGDKLLAVEGKRVAQLQQLGKTLNVPDAVINLSIANGHTVIDGRAAFLKHLTENTKPVTGLVGTVDVGVDQKIASLQSAIPDAICLRAGVAIEKPHERAAQLRNLTVVAMYQHYLAALGATDVFSLSTVQVVNLMSRRELERKYKNVAALAQSTSDFSSILADTINKTLRSSYKDAPKTWNIWAKKATNPDFKTITRAALSESPSLVARKEGGEIKYVTLSDSKETYVLGEFVSGIRLTRQAIINDDLNAFSDIPNKQAQACARLEDDTAYGIITANANLADTGALFNSTAVTTAGGHANLIGVGAVISVASLAATEQLLMAQTGPKNAARLELRGKFLLVPGSIYRTAQQLVSSQVDPAKNNAAINPFLNEGIVVVPSQRLNANSATAWYLLADYKAGQIDTVELCFLQGEEEPVLKQETDFDTEDMKFAVRHTLAGKAIDFRGMVKNPGA